MGTGPYKFVEWVRDDRVVLERNEQYWGPKPDVARVTIRPIPEGATRVAALLSGEVDVVEGVPIPDIPRVARTKGFPESLWAVIRRLEADAEPPMADTVAAAQPYQSAAELLADLQRIARDTPFSDDAWEKLLKHVADNAPDTPALKKAG